MTVGKGVGEFLPQSMVASVIAKKEPVCAFLKSVVAVMMSR